MANKELSALTAAGTYAGADLFLVVQSGNSRKGTLTTLFGGIPVAPLPVTSDAAALGSATLMWSDLFLASGGVINFNNGNMTITHAAGGLTVAGGTFSLPNTGLRLADSDASHYLIVKPGSNITANRTLTVTTGDADRTVSVNGDTTLSGTNTGDVVSASQAEMEAASSTTVFSSPSVQHHHPGHPKCWAYVTVSGGTPTLVTSFNITSITDTAVGQLTVTIATDFSSADWCPLTGIRASATTGADNIGIDRIETIAAGSVLIGSWRSDLTARGDPLAYSFAGFGDL